LHLVGLLYIIDSGKSSESYHDATSIQPPFLPLSVTNILSTASLFDILPEAPHQYLLLSSAICPTNDLTIW